MGAGLRLVERHVVQRNLHAKFVRESAEEVRRLLAAKSGTPTNLHGHSDSGRRTRKIIPRSQSPYLSMRDDGNQPDAVRDRKSTRLNSSHVAISYAVFC